MPQLFNGLWSPGGDCTDAPPVQPCEQSFKLGVREGHQAVPDIRPGKGMVLKALVGHHQTAAISVYEFLPIRPARPEDEHRPRERVLTNFVLHQRCQAIMPFRKSTGFVATMIRTRFDGKIMRTACRERAQRPQSASRTRLPPNGLSCGR